MKQKGLRPEDLLNVFLSPEYSRWLVGPIARMATAEEVNAYLALDDDAAAAAFIEEFWQRRDPLPGEEGNPVHELFERRSAEADSLYTEAAFPGGRTDRGTIHVLYGPPERVRYDISPRRTDPPIETWVYSSDARPGLDGKQPNRLYRFIKRGDLTVLYNPPPGLRLIEPNPS